MATNSDSSAVMIGVRLSAKLIEALDVEKERRSNLGNQLNRSDVIRTLLVEALQNAR